MALDFRASQFRGAKFIASGSTGTGASLIFYPITADSTTNPNTGVINTAKFGTGSIGTDIFLFVSGGISQKGSGGSHAISVFGGDLHISGNLSVGGSGTISGSTAVIGGDLLVSGALYFETGKRFTHFITIGSYTTTTTTSSNPQVAGQAVVSQSEIPSASIILRSVLSTTTGSVSASLKLFNVTSGSYVEIGGTGVTTLGTVSTTPTQIQSVNLFSATNFGTGSNIYEVQVYIGTGSQQAILGSSMFVCQ